MEIERKVKLLLDTNIFLELLMRRSRTEEVLALFNNPVQNEFFASDFSLHSVAIHLFRRRRIEGLKPFLKDMINVNGVQVVSLGFNEWDSLLKAIKDYHLDFDDSYQYAVAKKFGLTIVSFDSDFDRCDRGRKIPSMLLDK